jgi:hypothetical protein
VLAPEQEVLTRIPAVLLHPPPRPRPPRYAASEIVPLERSSSTGRARTPSRRATGTWRGRRERWASPR